MPTTNHLLVLLVVVMTACAGHGRVQAGEVPEDWPQTQEEAFKYFPDNIGPGVTDDSNNSGKYVRVYVYTFVRVCVCLLKCKVFHTKVSRT